MTALSLRYEGVSIDYCLYCTVKSVMTEFFLAQPMKFVVHTPVAIILNFVFRDSSRHYFSVHYSKRRSCKKVFCTWVQACLIAVPQRLRPDMSHFRCISWYTVVQLPP